MQPGQRIGKYVLGERIAIGGMAEVWAARGEGPQGFVKPLALKFMLESFSGDPELERLFVNEARVAAQLQHANIVSIFDFDKLDADHGGGLAGRYYIAMERVEGRDLRQLALAAQRTGSGFPRPLALHAAGEVLKGLRYVHERRGEGRRPMGLIHRDVSPHNVLVSYAGEVKLSDFGIAKARAHSTSGKVTGSVRGKLAYASPEQLDDLPLDHRTDQFAVGVTLWELLAGRRLFDGRDELSVINQVSRCEIPPFASLPAARGIDPAVEAVVRKMLSRRVEDRFPTTAEALSAVLSLPGYTADSVPLGNLVRGLFGTQTDFPAAGASSSPDIPGPASAALPDTMTMQAAPRSAAAGGERSSARHQSESGEGTVPTRAARPSSVARSSSPSVPTTPASAARSGAMVAVGLGLAVVIVLGLAMWRYLSSPDDVVIEAPQGTSTSSSTFRPATAVRPTIFQPPTPGTIEMRRFPVAGPDSPSGVPSFGISRATRGPSSSPPSPPAVLPAGPTPGTNTGAAAAPAAPAAADSPAVPPSPAPAAARARSNASPIVE